MKLTTHAKIRMVERGISKTEVLGVFDDPKYMISGSDADESALIATGKVGERFLSVVFDPETDIVFTVRAASRKERRKYDERAKKI